MIFSVPYGYKNISQGKNGGLVGFQETDLFLCLYFLLYQGCRISTCQGDLKWRTVFYHFMFYCAKAVDFRRVKVTLNGELFSFISYYFHYFYHTCTS